MAAVDSYDAISQRKEQPYEKLWKKREIPPVGKFTSSRPPNLDDVPSGDDSVDYMLRSELPLEKPRDMSLYDSDSYKLLSPSEKADVKKAYSEAEKIYHSKTKVNTGNGYLGNFDKDLLISEVNKRFRERTKEENSDGDLFFYGNGFDSKTDYLAFIKRIQECLPLSLAGKAVESFCKRAMGSKYDPEGTTQTEPLLQFHELPLKFYEDSYITEKQTAFTTSMAESTRKINQLVFPEIPAQPGAVGPDAAALLVGAAVGDPNFRDGTARNALTVPVPGHTRVRAKAAADRKEAALRAHLATPIAGGHTGVNLQNLTFERAQQAESVYDLTVAQEAAALRLIPLNSLQPNQNVEFTWEQKHCARELQAAMSNVLYCVIMDNTRGQAHTTCENFGRKGDGWGLCKHLNFLYRGGSIVTTSHLQSSITSFPSWFEKHGDPTDSLVKFRQLNEQLHSFRNMGFSESMQVNTIFSALQNNIHYHVLSATLDSLPHAEHTVENLTVRIVKFYQDSHKGWGFDQTAKERGGKFRELSTKVTETQKLKAQLNSMQQQMQKMQQNNGFKSKFKRKAASVGGASGSGSAGGNKSKKLKRDCAICGKSNHSTSMCNLKPDGTFCYKCGLLGHTADKCNSKLTVFEKKSAGKVANTATKPTTVTFATGTDSAEPREFCTICKRSGHLASVCKTVPCRKCGSKERHDWMGCTGSARAFSIEKGVDEGESYKSILVSDPTVSKWSNPKKKTCLKFKHLRLSNDDCLKTANRFETLSLDRVKLSGIELSETDSDSISSLSPHQNAGECSQKTTGTPCTGLSEEAWAKILGLSEADIKNMSEVERLSGSLVRLRGEVDRHCLSESEYMKVSEDTLWSFPLVSLEDSESDLSDFESDSE